MTTITRNAHNKTDVIIPFGKGSRNNNIELTYCLRSIDKHLKNYGNIYIIGEFVSLPNVINIQVKDMGQDMWKEKNIYNKLQIAAKDKRVSENFLWISDDHFFVQDIDAKKISAHHKGLMKPLYEKRKHKDDAYSHSMKNTLHLFGEEIKCFDVHAPMMFTKQNMHILEKIEWRKSYGYCIKTVYCILNNIAGTFYSDCKINKRMTKPELYNLVKERKYFSCGDNAFPDLQYLLQELFPFKSKYEK